MLRRKFTDTNIFANANINIIKFSTNFLNTKSKLQDRV